MKTNQIGLQMYTVRERAGADLVTHAAFHNTFMHGPDHGALDEFQPNRIAVDSPSALERTAPDTGFREFLISLTSFIKKREIAGLCTATSKSLIGGESASEQHISTLTDSIILLRYVEDNGRVRRCISLLKMRGSRHDHDIREYDIDGGGMHIGGPLRGVHGILSGVHSPIAHDEEVRDPRSSGDDAAEERAG